MYAQAVRTVNEGNGSAGARRAENTRIFYGAAEAATVRDTLRAY